MMNKLHEQRWNHAVKIFTRINEYIEKKYIIFDGDNEILPRNKFVIDKENLRIYQPHNLGSYGYFEEADLYITTKQFEDSMKLKAWGFVNPQNVKRFRRWNNGNML